MVWTVARARIKICGITSVTDALAAQEAGADAIGLVFYEPSPRAIDINHAQEIARSVGPFVTTVGLFVNAEPAYVSEVLNRVPLHVLQFHGDETSAYCESFRRPYMKAIRMRPALDLASAIANYPSAAAILLDAFRPGIPGGTGETFDWQRVPQNINKAIVLAGGLTSANVAEAIQTTNVYGVDVSGGVESAPGTKDAVKVREFIINASHGSNR
jgi:phosphoribosylanthranilate isomerase